MEMETVGNGDEKGIGYKWRQIGIEKGVGDAMEMEIEMEMETETDGNGDEDR